MFINAVREERELINGASLITDGGKLKTGSGSYIRLPYSEC